MEAETFRAKEEVPLQATTEDEAVTEATEKWAELELDAASKAQWEKQKKTWAHPPVSPTEWGPRDPLIVYQFPLKSK